MKNKLLVSGCSITHGSELHHPFYHTANIEKSYPALVAKKIDFEFENLAVPGASNEYIYHSLVNSIRKSAPHTVLAAWTFTDRMHWQHSGRHWFFAGSWSATFKDFENSGQFQKKSSGAYFSADQENLLDPLELAHRFLIQHYFDPSEFLFTSELIEKLADYSYSLRSICQANNINLIEIDAANNYGLNIKRLENLKLNYIQQNRHPNQQEHELIADFIVKNYFEKG